MVYAKEYVIDVKHELKPCPFCGSNITAVVRVKNEYACTCLDCDASSGLENKIEHAVDIWNLRVK